MNSLKRSVAFLLLICLLFLSACSKGKSPADNSSTPDNTVTASSPETLSLFYCAKDSLNPYAATTEYNIKLHTLMYDPLIRLDPEFQPQYIIAEAAELLGKVCTINIKDINFTDGSKLTAEDVVYSYKLAKESSLIYKEQLSNVKDCKAKDGNVVFTLSKADPYFINLLDFPIIKAKSEKITDENKIILPPIGSGRYIFDRNQECLYANASHVGGAPEIKSILLIDAPDDEVSKFNLESGNISVYNTDLLDGIMPSMLGTIELSPLNNLVYLGLNLNRKILSDVKMRYVVSSAINRAALCTEAYYTYALPAEGLFSPLWQDAEGLQNISSESNLQNCVANLKELGYNNKDNEGFYVDSNNKRISLTLVCNSENERRVKAANLIKAQLELAGINVTVKALNWNQYVSALSSGDFDLYIAEVRLMNNMDVTELITSNGSLSYGIPNKVTDDKKNETKDTANDPKAEAEAEPENKPSEEITHINDSLDGAVNGFYSEQLSLIDIINAFNAEMPIIPLCYRSGITVYDARFDIENLSSVSDAYYNITNIKLK